MKRSIPQVRASEKNEEEKARHGQKAQQPGRFFLDRKQRWTVVMRINNRMK